MKDSVGWVKAVLVIGALAAAVLYGTRSTVVPALDLPAAKFAANGNGEDPCDGKPRCLVVYVAPWCPSCAEAKPVIAEIKERFHGSSKLGVKTIVGMDERPKLETYAETLGPGTFLDPNQSFSKAAGVKSIPTWLVMDPRGKILRRFAGAYPTAEDQLDKLALDPVSLAAVQ